MKANSRGALACAFIIGLPLMTACQGFSTGPSLQVNVPSRSLALSATTGDDQVCCCNVAGVAINGSTVPIHASLKFQAFSRAEDEPIGTTFAFLCELQPGEERTFRTVGFLFPCSFLRGFELSTEFDETVPQGDVVALVDLDLRSADTPDPRVTLGNDGECQITGFAE